jgi:RecB family exonuclease
MDDAPDLEQDDKHEWLLERFTKRLISAQELRGVIDRGFNLVANKVAIADDSTWAALTRLSSSHISQS